MTERLEQQLIVGEISHLEAKWQAAEQYLRTQQDNLLTISDFRVYAELNDFYTTY